jgi:uncharacterized protein (TIGR02186 family)
VSGGRAPRPAARRGTAPLLATALLAAALLGTCLALAGAVRAQQLVADISSHLIAITTGFTGTDVVLFGAVDGPGDVAVVVEGPQGRVTVRRKERIAGIWINASSMGFEQVPGYYAVASSRPIERIAEPAVLSRHEIGLQHLSLEPTDDVPAEALAEWRRALLRNKQEEGLFPRTPGQVTFLGGRLFRTTVHFPANVPTGSYTVSVYLIRNGDVVSAQTTPLVVSKIGFSADVFELATSRSTLYGLGSIVLALSAGWTAGAIFRRV